MIKFKAKYAIPYNGTWTLLVRPVPVTQTVKLSDIIGKDIKVDKEVYHCSGWSMGNTYDQKYCIWVLVDGELKGSHTNLGPPTKPENK